MPNKGRTALLPGWHYVYVLYSSKDGKFYIGYTQNLSRRLTEHNAGMNFSTKGRTPFRLIYAEAGLQKEDAIRRERYLKTTQGRRLLKLRLKEFLKIVSIVRNSSTGYADR